MHNEEEPRLDDPVADAKWKTMSDLLLIARNSKAPSALNDELAAASRNTRDQGLANAFRLWSAENLAREGRSREALSILDELVEEAGDAEFLGVSVGGAALKVRAQALERIGQIDEAMASRTAIAKRAPTMAGRALAHAAEIAERSNRVSEAVSFYKQAAEKEDSAVAARPGLADVARRRAVLLESPEDIFFGSPEVAAREAIRALQHGDTERAQGLTTPDWFQVGPIGGCHDFVDQHVALQRLVEGIPTAWEFNPIQLLGHGDKRSLELSGLIGEWFSGSVALTFNSTPLGWYWSGLSLHNPTEAWFDEWEPDSYETNQPLPWPIAAPWPEGISFMAGGIKNWVAQETSLLGISGIVGLIYRAILSARPCGFGTRGFYYNFGSHRGAEAFSIDFTRYLQAVPYNNVSRGVDVLSVMSGVVRIVEEANPTGSNSVNEVYVQHPHNGVMAYESRYLHLDGPNLVRVSPMQYVRRGTVLGDIDDTGWSQLHHLHFSMYDIDAGWTTVRPTPMAGVTLNDGNGGRCVKSTTRPYRGWSFYEGTLSPLRTP